jgi:GMP synthase (glutamine-hydrolysing)
MKSCLALRHVQFEDLGMLDRLLRRRDFTIRYLEAGVDDLAAPEIEAPDLLVVLGGPIGVYEEEHYPFLVPETAAIARRLARRRPTLGICLGAQLMAKALGAEVAPGPAKEIGWAPIELTKAGRQGPLRHLDGVHVLHWHGDNLALPDGGETLAVTKACPVQAFRRGSNLLGLQFHAEAEGRRLEAWLIGHTVELGKAGFDPRRIRDDTKRYGAALERKADLVFDEWLDQLSE